MNEEDAATARAVGGAAILGGLFMAILAFLAPVLGVGGAVAVAMILVGFVVYSIGTEVENE